jgi:hypothetical protein
VYLIWVTVAGGIVGIIFIPFVHFFVPGGRELAIIACCRGAVFFWRTALL